MLQALDGFSIRIDPLRFRFLDRIKNSANIGLTELGNCPELSSDQNAAPRQHRYW
jgi:hypothetical protein